MTSPGPSPFAPKLVFKSQSMADTLEKASKIAAYHTTVLIMGESGTGKELIARHIHALSPRANKPFVAVNCGAIPENLMESEFFGHKKGSFTDASRDKKGLIEEANEGSLFLDEIGELPLQLQVKLLRTLQEHQIRRVGDEQEIDVDIRVIAATHRNLEEDVRAGRFREDLYYRLHVVSIEIPPLRDRPEDIPALVEYFLEKQNKRLGLTIKGFEPDAMDMLCRYPWRGNVRELENCVERAMVLSENSVITLSELPNFISLSGSQDRKKSFTENDSLSIKQRTRDLEIELIERALEKTHGNRTHAAKILEISHRALLYKLKEYGIE